MSRFRAPRNGSRLCVGDVAVGRNGPPDAEVVDRVDHCELALGLRAFGRAVAEGVATLGTAACVVFRASRR